MKIPRWAIKKLNGSNKTANIFLLTKWPSTNPSIDVSHSHSCSMFSMLDKLSHIPSFRLENPPVIFLKGWHQCHFAQIVKNEKKVGPNAIFYSLQGRCMWVYIQHKIWRTQRAVHISLVSIQQSFHFLRNIHFSLVLSCIIGIGAMANLNGTTSDLRTKFLEVYSVLKSELLNDSAFEWTDNSRQWVERVSYILFCKIFSPVQENSTEYLLYFVI